MLSNLEPCRRESNLCKFKTAKEWRPIPFVLPQGSGALMRDMVIVPTKSHFNPNPNGSEKLFCKMEEGGWCQIACRRRMAVIL